MRRLALVALAACADPPPPVDGVSCEATVTMFSRAPAPELDIVLVVSDAAPMAAYVDDLATKMPDLARVYQFSEGGLASLRVLAVGPDGTASAPIDDFALPWFWCPGEPTCRDRNYDGDLGEAIAALASITPTEEPATPLLARLEHALRDHRILRPHAELLIIIVSATDDASPDDPELIAARIDALHPFGWAAVSAILGPDTPRLHALLEEFPDRNAWIPIDDANWIDAFRPWSIIDEPWVGGCVDRATLDPECSATEADGTPIPACTMNGDVPDPDTPLPCVHLEPVANDPWCPVRAVVERANAEPRPLATLRCPCGNLVLP